MKKGVHFDRSKAPQSLSIIKHDLLFSKYTLSSSKVRG